MGDERSAGLELEVRGPQPVQDHPPGKRTPRENVDTAHEKVRGLVVGILAALGDALYFGYSEGAYNMMNGGFWNGPKNILNKAVAVMRTPTPAWGKGRAGFAVAGAFVMLLLTIVRYRAQWWPLHPVGFAVQGTFGLTKTFFSILIAWGLKSTLLRIGGVALYEKGKPFFIGLLVG